MWLYTNNVNMIEFLKSYLSPNLTNSDKIENKTYAPLYKSLKFLFPDTFH